MKLSRIITLLILAAALFTAGCSKKFDDYSQNKNLPTRVPPSLVLPSILNDLVVKPGGSEDKYSQFIVSNYNYYGDNKYWTGSASLNYGSLNNVLAMESEARRLAGSDKNPYHALGLFFRAFFFVSMSEKVGDLPMTDALKGLNNPAPKYDAQKDIFKQSLLWLDSANTLLAGFIQNGFLEFSGDFYYKGGDGTDGRGALIEWQKVVNSYKLRVLIELSKRADDAADLNIKSQFAAIVSNPAQYPVFTSNDDNLKYVYNSTYNYYPDNPQNYGNNAGRLNLAATLETTLGQLNDLRAMVLGEPARGLGYADTDYRSFVGGRSGDDVSLLSTLSGSSSISLYNYNHFYTTFTAEPTYVLSYPEVCFAIAEGASRGWVTGQDIAAWYRKGVEAQFAFYGIKDGSNQVVFRNKNGDGSLTYTVNFIYDNYFSQDAVKLKGDVNDLTKILTQKYLAYARNSGLQGYYQWRRTGIPPFSTGTGTGNGGKIPLRFQYPTNEVSANGTNYTAALQSQYGGSDDINAAMWLIK